MDIWGIFYRHLAVTAWSTVAAAIIVTVFLKDCFG